MQACQAKLGSFIPSQSQEDKTTTISAEMLSYFSAVAAPK